MHGNFLTIRDLAKELEIEPNAVKLRLFRLKIKPITAEAIYDEQVLDILRNVPGKGRPKTKPEQEKSKATKKTKVVKKTK